ncbi:peptidoglycan DD-metalloendopeptidase family protein [Microbacterium sp.]|uniref:M23 family metallopeptidase n=1 Tax=Microbacterium sp. TaxID=51671 RepID=UPI00261C42C8|nr:peptidoglycan DD-metalloendopeptidase family protein [Microbacterium sp.]
MAESVPTRRSSRRRNAEPAITTESKATAPEEAETVTVLDAAVTDPAVLAPAQPLSRRAARERQRAAAQPASAADGAQATPVVDIVKVVADPAPVKPAAVGSSVKRVRAQRARVERVEDEQVVAESVSNPESVIAKSVIVESVAAEPVEVVHDPFVAASRAFGASAVEVHASDADQPAEVVRVEATAHGVPRRRRVSRRLVAFGATVGVMGIAGMLAVSMTLPAEAVAAARGTQVAAATSLLAAAKSAPADVAEDEIQAFVAPSDVQNDLIERTEDFSTASLVDIAAERGIQFSDELYTNDPDAAIQWPFVVGVGMSYGFGMRSGRMHEGIDLVPGAGAPVQSIADGTVRIATEAGGNYGVTVYIDHVIDGQVITSHYSHMQYGSLRVVAGQEVKVGDIIGNVGNTGRSYGAHMHFELIVDDVKIDPLPWMQENAGRYDY